METALSIITDRLVSTGMTEIEAEHLLARFLQEEAFQFVECMNLYQEDPEAFRKLTEAKYKA